MMDVTAEHSQQAQELQTWCAGGGGGKGGRGLAHIALCAHVLYVMSGLMTCRGSPERDALSVLHSAFGQVHQ